MVDLPMMGRAGMPDTAAYFPPAPQNSFGSLGGLGQGFTGFVNSPQGGDVLSAIGMSLLSSPRNSPMQALPQLLGGLQQQRFQQQKYDEALKEQERRQLETQQEREALVVAAKSVGLSEEEARSLAINPTALKMRLDQVQTERAHAERNQFMQGVPPLYGEPTQVQQPADVSQDSWGALAQEYGWAPQGGEPDTFPMAQPQMQAQPHPAAPMSRNTERLMHQREQEVNRLYAAPDDITRKFIEGRIGQIDKMIEQQGSTDTQKNLEWRAREAGVVPGTPEYQNFMLTGGKSDSTNITVNTGEGDKFYENLDKKNAETFSALSETGVGARAKLSQIERLDGLLSAAPSGASAMLKQAAGEYGIATEGLDDIQAAQAMINELVPQQRQPGSGPMSDADLALFKQSLPRLINTPTGNRLIVDTMRGITEYQIKMGEIADLVADREISPSEGRRAIRELANPLEGYAKNAQAIKEGAAAGSQPAPQARPRAVNPSTGQAMEYDGTRWVPVQ